MTSEAQATSELRIPLAHLAGIRAIGGSVTGDGHGLIVSVGDDDMLRSWDATTGAPREFIQRSQVVASFVDLASTPEGPLVVSGDVTGVRRWYLSSGRPVGEPIRQSSMFPATGGFDSLAVCSDGGVPLLFGGDSGGRVQRWNLVTGVSLGEPSTGHDGAVLGLGWIRLGDGRLVVVSGGRDGTVRRWDGRTGEQIGLPMLGHRRPVTAVACVNAYDGRDLIVTQGVSGIVRRWDAATGEPVGGPMRVEAGTGRSARGVAVSPDGRVLLSISRDGALWRWDLTVAEPVAQPIPGYHPRLMGISAVPAVVDGGALFVTGSEDGVLRRWDVTGRAFGDALAGHPAPAQFMVGVPASTASGGRGLLISDGQDGARCWDAATGESVTPKPVLALYGLAPIWLPDRRLVLASGFDGGIGRSDVFGGALLGMSPELPDTPVWSVAAATLPDGTRLVVGADGDGLLHRIDAVTGETLGPPLRGDSDQALAVAVTVLPDGVAMLAAGGTDQMVLRWNAVTGEPIGAPLAGHEMWVMCLAFIPLRDGQVMLVAVDDGGEVRRWDAVSGQPLGEPFASGRGEEITSLRLAVVDSLWPPQLLTAGSDEVVRRWDAVSGALLEEMPDALCAASTVLVDGRTLLAIGGTDSVIRLRTLE